MAIPPPAQFTSSPLRNRIRVELSAPVADVWTLIGDLTRFPEYSPGIERVEDKKDTSGACTEYVCYFKPQAEGEEPIRRRELMKWYEPGRGYASMPEEPNAFGLERCLTLVLLEPAGTGTVVTWDEYYDNAGLEAAKAAFDQALGEIGDELARRFGGSVTERFLEG